ncbi:MAG: glycosyltransferase [Methylobacter sp.]|nr:glycosyltransferase [Methylobacter sp.]
MTKTIFSNLSVVIPIGPDDQSWRLLLNQLVIFGQEIEIILAASQQPPADIELPANAEWLHLKQGRARQLNAGVRHARHRMIWLLHADSRLTSGVMTAMQNYIEAGNTCLGYFRLRFDADGPKKTCLNAWAANLRSRFFGLPFGDQGFIVNNTVFEQLNGFDENLLLGEDLDFVVRLKAAGVSLQEMQADLITSARRYRQQGWLATTLRHIWLTWYLFRQARRRLAQGS